MKKIIISIIVSLSLLSCSTSNIAVLVNRDKSLNNEYVLKTEKELKKIGLDAIKKMDIELIKKTIPNIPNKAFLNEGLEKYMLKMTDILTKNATYELKTMAYLSKDKIDLEFVEKNIDITMVTKKIVKIFTDPMKLKTLVEGVISKDEIEKFNELGKEEGMKKIMERVFSIVLDEVQKISDEVKKENKYIYTKKYVTLQKKGDNWIALPQIRKYESNDKYSVLSKEKNNINDEYIEVTKNEINKIYKKTMLEETKKTLNEAMFSSFEISEDILDNFITKLYDGIEFEMKGIYFIDENNIIVKAENKQLDMLDFMTNSEYMKKRQMESSEKMQKYSMELMNQGLSMKEMMNKMVEYSFKEIYDDESIKVMKDSGKYLYSNTYIRYTKINGVWTINEMIKKSK